MKRYRGIEARTDDDVVHIESRPDVGVQLGEVHSGREVSRRIHALNRYGLDAGLTITIQDLHYLGEGPPPRNESPVGVMDLWRAIH